VRYLSAIIAGVITYPIAFAIMAELFNVRQDSWYWLPFAASSVAVVMVARPWHANAGRKLRRAVAVTAASVIAVLAIDLNGGVWYSRIMTILTQDASSPRSH
jgi:hypothetical protein